MGNKNPFGFSTPPSSNFKMKAIALDNIITETLEERVSFIITYLLCILIICSDNDQVVVSLT